MRPIEIAQLGLLTAVVIAVLIVVALGVEIPEQAWTLIYVVAVRETVGLAAGKVANRKLVLPKPPGPAVALLGVLGLGAITSGCELGGPHRCDNLAKSIAYQESAVVVHEAECSKLEGNKERDCKRALAFATSALEATRSAHQVECSGQ